MSELLEVRDLSKRFGGLVANRDVSFTVAEGEVVGLIGPNGAGKTTLFNCISGFFPPTSGQVHFAGREITGWPPERALSAGLARSAARGSGPATSSRTNCWSSPVWPTWRGRWATA